ncbi:uncharacterized protein E5676_scaffold1704G00090 [Cucumis melo var. makuwa]|uniref:Reverse transcriptase domain-containing protein n=1 Tax=Cucumis melo var. makuwa TaxID=1194695 RepID=A0A5A7VJ26_CUCMM|nr:uncharacterized protein E6C27_scaffold179G00670 [Cucumis melo var. makuwa]TYK30668.1 uncharacterized protein E5676_scaffold1704G00090 [Cucumis melo var. makuwa]
MMAKAGYDFTAHTEFKSLKIHEQPELSSIQKKLLWEGHAIRVSRKGLGYKLPEPIHITRKGKEKVVDSNHITVEEVDSMEEKEGDSQRTLAFVRIRPHVACTPIFERLSMTEIKRKGHQSISNLDERSAFQRLTTTFKKDKGTCQASTTTRPSSFERLSLAKKKNVQTPHAPIFNHLGDEGPHIKTSSSIDTKKKESTSRASVGVELSIQTSRITMVRSFLMSQGSLKVKRHDVILTNLEKEDSEQEEAETSCHHITILKELEIRTPEEDAEDVPQSLEDEYKDIFAWSYKEMPELDSKIEVEVNKLIEAGFIHEAKYPTWIANIVPVRKKNKQLHVCVDFRDLNNACPKDDFPLLITEFMVNATTEHETLSFMDGSSGYNQIRMALSDEEMTAFRTPKGIYCYKVMSFGLKNVGATYQRAMQKVFDDMLHKYVECYVDDLVVKSKRRQDHMKDLKFVFDCLRKYQLRMNPLKCTFGKVSRRIVGARGGEGKGTSLYYLSKTLVGAEVNYSPIEKIFLALFFAIDKLRHYMLAFTIHLVANADLLLQQYDIVYILQKAIKGQALADFLADHPIPSDWKLCEDLPDNEVFFTEVMEPWTMYFDGTTRRSGARADIVLISPEKHMLPYSFALAELCSDNVALDN